MTSALLPVMVVRIGLVFPVGVRMRLPSTLDPRLSTLFTAGFLFHLHVELHAGDLPPLSSRDAQAPALELEFFEFALQLASSDAEINQRAEEHVAADPAEDVQVKSFHWSLGLAASARGVAPPAASSFIRLAA